MLGSGCKIISPFILILARTWQQVVPGLIFSAVAGLYMPALQALIAESLPSERMGAAFGAYRTISNSPNIFVPVISGFYMDRLGIINGVRVTLMINIVTATAVFLTRGSFLQETLFKEDAQKTMIEKNTFREAASDLIRSLSGSRTLLLMVIISCIGSFAMRMVYPFLSIYAVHVIGLETTQWGLLQSLFSVISIPLFMFGGVLSDKIGRVPCIILARAIAPTQYLGLQLISNFNVLMGLFFLLGIGGGLGGGGISGGGYMGGPSWQALLADIIPNKNRGKVLGFMATITGLLNLPASVIGGYILEDLSPSMLLTIGFMVGASIIPIMTFYLREPKTRKKQ